MQEIKLDISKRSVVPLIHAKQCEVGRKFRVTLYDNGADYAAPPSAGVSVWYSGASGEGNYSSIGDDAAVTVHENEIEVEMIAQMLLNAGPGMMCLVLQGDSDKQIATWNIPYMVEHRPGMGSSVAKEYYNAFSKPDSTLSVAGRAADAAAVGTALATVKEAILFTPQPDLSEEQKAQARENIGVIEYYSTAREEVGVGHDAINSAYIWSLYDALMEKYPDKVQKKEVYNNDGTFTNYEYVISVGDHNEEDKGKYPERDLDITKPKYLIMSGIHGTERPAVISTYRFVKDLLTGKSALAPLLEGAVLHILPVGTPDAFDAFTYENADGVNINRDFTAEVFAKETQAIANWVKANTDADLFIDHHNGGTVYEVSLLIGMQDNQAVDTAKKIALRGLDRIIPYWRDVIKYSKTLLDHNDEPQNVVFSYSISNDVPSSATQYALEKYGVTSLALETSVYQNGNYSDYKKDEKICTPETIAAGAEALGNIMIEFYNQSFFGEVVGDMANIERKLDTLMETVNSGFRKESGVYAVAEDINDGSSVTVKIPCTSGAKLLVFQADEDDGTYEAITATSGVNWTIGVFGQCIAKIGYRDKRGYLARMQLSSNGTKWVTGDSATTCNNADGFTFVCGAMKAGTYNWTAYYWND